MAPLWACPATGASDVSCLVQPEMVVAVGSPVEGLLNREAVVEVADQFFETFSES